MGLPQTPLEGAYSALPDPWIAVLRGEGGKVRRGKGRGVEGSEKGRRRKGTEAPSPNNFSRPQFRFSRNTPRVELVGRGD